MVKLWIDDPKVLFDHKSWNPLEGSTEEKINIMTKYIIIYGMYKAVTEKNSKKLTRVAIYVGIAMMFYIFLVSNKKDEFKNPPVNTTSTRFINKKLEMDLPHSVYDARMGVLVHNKKCITCKKDKNKCPGHFGHIKLSKPVYHYHFIHT